MRRLATILLLAPVIGVLVVFGTGARSDSEGGYEVRAIFDNGAFLVPGVDVRIAGAKVGSVSEVDITGIDEAAHSDGSPQPGKAVAVLNITDPAFQDFRSDASCRVRPQSLLGDKFVECTPTAPHAAASAPSPALEEIDEGEPGEGERFLGLEQNGKAVDLDLLNDIMRRPYPDRFRLILNDLGAGLAARGDDLNEIIERANPALRETDEVLAILAAQNRQLANLASDGDQALQPLAAERRHISGFINNAETSAAATAERSADLEAGLQKLPAFLRELRGTMGELDSFATQSGPVVSDLGDAAPDLERATVALEPFAEAGTGALRSLGNAAEEVGPNLENSQPVIRDLGELARKQLAPARNLGELLASFRRTGGYEQFGRLIYFAAGALNGFDSYGHILRALVPVNNCYGYNVNPESSCASFFTAGGVAVKRDNRQLAPVDVTPEKPSSERESGGSAAEEPAPTEVPPDAETSGEETPGAGEATGEAAQPVPGTATPGRGSTRMLLDYLFGPERPAKSPRRAGR